MCAWLKYALDLCFARCVFFPVVCAKVLMAPKSKMAAKAKAKAKGRAKLSRFRRQQLSTANVRQQMRRDAVRSLNDLATELELERVQVPMKGLLASEPKVDRIIRVLEPRCQTAALAQRLRAAVQLWKDDGGALSQPMTDAADPNAPGSGDEADDSDVPLLPRHRVLQPGYILKS